MNKQEQQYPVHSYGTGSTRPRKSRMELLAVVAAGVVLLGGCIRLSSLLNIRKPLEETEAALVFSRQTSQVAAEAAIGDRTPMLGIRCEAVSSFLQIYYGLPQGVYVTQVLSEGPAMAAGLTAGDIIIAFAGTPVKDPMQLQSLLYKRMIGEAVSMTVVRGGKTHPVTVILAEENGES